VTGTQQSQREGGSGAVVGDLKAVEHRQFGGGGQEAQIVDAGVGERHREVDYHGVCG
jgi:hypothetical protein